MGLRNTKSLQSRFVTFLVAPVGDPASLNLSFPYTKSERKSESVVTDM